MSGRGFEADFSAAVLAEVRDLKPPFGPIRRRGARRAEPAVVLDRQRRFARPRPAYRDRGARRWRHQAAGGGGRRHAAVTPGSALDGHAAINTTSIYTPPQNFPMLPDRLSTDLTSLVRAEDRLAVVVDTVVDDEGVAGESSVYPAVVRNQAKLAYPSVGAWLEDRGEMPAAVARSPGWPTTSGSRTGSLSASRPAVTSAGAGTRDDRGAHRVRRRCGERAGGGETESRQGDH